MPLPWVKLDNAFPRNHKVLTLLGQKDGHRAIVTYVCGLTYASEQGTDGFIPREALMLCHGRPTEAKKLVEVRLWHLDPGGWLINDWTEHQPTSQEMEKRSLRARSAAQARWSKPPPRESA
jgi:hypothetical protein